MYAVAQTTIYLAQQPRYQIRKRFQNNDKTLIAFVGQSRRP